MKTNSTWKMAYSFLSFVLIGMSITFGQIISLDLSGMTPHMGQKLEVRLIDKMTMEEVDRNGISSISMAAFSISFSGVVVGNSYYIDFYTDANSNGMYDAPPTDHVWRVEANNVTSGTMNVAFSHNTNFQDIKWKHELTLDLTGMTPHVGQLFEYRLIDINQGMLEVYRGKISSIAMANFTIDMPYLTPGQDYYLDFYADLNGNSLYDSPPTDHAWRDSVMNVSGDEIINFSHNTNFTDIMWSIPTGIETIFNNSEILIYPNPTNGNVFINLGENQVNVEMNLTNIQGKLIQRWSFDNIYTTELILDAPQGLYFLNINRGNDQKVLKIIIE